VRERVVLDTDVLIAALDRRDAHHRAAARGFRAMIEQEVTVLLSLINYAEALVKPAESERMLDAAIDAIAALGISLVAPTPTIAREAARNRAFGVSLADGFAMATATAQAASLAAFDRRVQRVLPRVGLELNRMS
jgi:predicted nucleic acid-binding protein